MLTPPEGNREDGAEVLGTEPTPLSERRRGMTHRGGATVVASTCLVVLAVLAGYFLTPSPSSPALGPAVGARVRITHVGVPAEGNLTFGLTLQAAATSLVAVVGAREGYSDVIVHVPLPPRPLAPGQTGSLHVRATVCDCWMPRPPRGTPLLYLTLRTPGGDRYVAVVPTRAQFDRLDRILRRSCAS